MATKIIDLDEFLGADKQVRLGGKLYVLPPDLPAELYLKINKFAQTDASELEMVEALYDEVLGLFRYKDPKLGTLPISLSQLVVAVGRIYGDAAEGDATPPPARRTRGGAASSKTTAKRSR